MQVAGHHGVVGVVAAIVLLSVLIVFISPCVNGFPAHLRAKRAVSPLMGQFAWLATTAISVRTITTDSSAIVELHQFVSTAPILPLICVHIC